MNVETYIRLRKIAADENKTKTTTPKTRRYTPEDVYGAGFTKDQTVRATPVSADYDRESQAAREAAFKKQYPNAKIIPGHRFPVISRVDPEDPSKSENLWPLLLYNQGVFNKPIEEVIGVTPTTGSAIVAPYPFSVDPKLHKAVRDKIGVTMVTSSDDVQARAYPGTVAGMNAYLKFINPLLLGMNMAVLKRGITQDNLRRHELFDHGATNGIYPTLLPSIASVWPTLVSRNISKNGPQLNSRGIYGLKSVELAGGMHSVKSAWGRRHPTEKLSNEWDVAMKQLMSKGYIDPETRQFNDKLWDDVGYDANMSTINSAMEGAYGDMFNGLKDIQGNPVDVKSLKDSLLDDMRWYWPQSRNRSATEQLQRQVNPQPVYNTGYWTTGKGIPS